MSDKVIGQPFWPVRHPYLIGMYELKHYQISCAQKPEMEKVMTVQPMPVHLMCIVIICAYLEQYVICWHFSTTKIMDVLLYFLSFE